MPVSLLLAAILSKCGQSDINGNDEHSCRDNHLVLPRGDMPRTKRERGEHPIRKEKAKDAECMNH
jgi:hypothetical protein